MGKTVPSYRMAIECEIAHWKGFRDGLASEEEKQAFDDVMDMCRMQSAAGSVACNPILFEPMIVSILLEQQKRIRILQRKIDALLVTSLPMEKAE
ncbi:MAG TPA: hypothetical protein VEF91_03535 [Verrucomicrobiae bacterium]|nr:hypothetical protein [Verrucomicrobiae bacterium]